MLIKSHQGSPGSWLALSSRKVTNLVTVEAARGRFALGLRCVEQCHLAGSKNGLELSTQDHKVLSLRNRGLWPSEIAVLLGMRVQSVRYRLERFKKAGFTFPPPTAPRPIPHRKVTDDELLTLAKSRAFNPGDRRKGWNRDGECSQENQASNGAGLSEGPGFGLVLDIGRRSRYPKTQREGEANG
jgi:hypothetical protein